MKRIGIVFLVVGLACFVWASGKRSGYDSVEGTLKATFSSSERSKKEGWETTRWISAGLAVVGLALLAAPARKP
jgi:hypothetical protein